MNKAEVMVGVKGDTTDIKKKVGSLGSELKSSMSGLTGVIAGAFSVGAIIGFGKSVMSAADAIANTSQALGVGTDSLQALKAMAVDSGIQFDEVAAGLNRIAKAQAEALTGNAQLQKAFKTFGVSLSDLQGLSPDQIMQKIGAGLKEGGRSAEETSATFEVLGKSSGRLMGFLEELGSQGLDATIQKFKDLGMVMDAAAIKKLDETGDAMERFKIKSQTMAGEALLGWDILWNTLAGVSSGLSLGEARLAAAQGLGMLGGEKKPGENGEGAAEDLKPTAEDNKWYALMEEKTLARMDLTAKIAYYEQEISALQKSRAQNPTDLTIASEILEREKKIRALKDRQTRSDEAESTKLDAMYKAQDDLAADYAKKRKDILNPKDASLTGPSRVDSLQSIGGLIGGVSGKGDQAARIAERQAKSTEAIETLMRETNSKLDELNSKIDGIIAE